MEHGSFTPLVMTTGGGWQERLLQTSGKPPFGKARRTIFNDDGLASLHHLLQLAKIFDSVCETQKTSHNRRNANKL